MRDLVESNVREYRNENVSRGQGHSENLSDSDLVIFVYTVGTAQNCNTSCMVSGTHYD